MKKEHKNKKKDCNKNDNIVNSSIRNKKHNYTDGKDNYEDLVKELNQLNISFDTLLVILLAVILNIYYIYFSKVKVLDKINNTKCAEHLVDGTKIPRISNEMFLYSTAVFLEINFNNYENVIKDKESDEKSINKAYKQFFSTILVLIATILSRSNLEI